MTVRAGMLSTVIPVYNGARYLAEAIESALAQGHEPMEILVVDDGSSDDSHVVASSFGPPVRVIRQPHGGLGAARNRGVRSAVGEFVAFLDADDVWMPDKTRLQMGALMNDPELDLVFGHVREFVSPDVDAAVRASVQWSEDPQPGRSGSTFMARRTVFRRAGFFNEDLVLAEYVDWLARARAAGLTELLLPDVVARRRIHGANTTIRNRAARGDYVRALKAAVAGHRRADRGRDERDMPAP